MEMRVRASLIHWRGPSPFHFVSIPKKESEQIKSLSRQLTYGWGVIPVKGRIGATTFSTSLFPKGASYLIPIKVAVRTAERLEIGDSVTVDLTFELSSQ
jgi:hypothetical protein